MNNTKQYCYLVIQLTKHLINGVLTDKIYKFGPTGSIPWCARDLRPRPKNPLDKSDIVDWWMRVYYFEGCTEAHTAHTTQNTNLAHLNAWLDRTHLVQVLAQQSTIQPCGQQFWDEKRRFQYPWKIWLDVGQSFIASFSIFY